MVPHPYRRRRGRIRLTGRPYAPRLGRLAPESSVKTAERLDSRRRRPSDSASGSSAPGARRPTRAPRRRSRRDPTPRWCSTGRRRRCPRPPKDPRRRRDPHPPRIHRCLRLSAHPATTRDRPRSETPPRTPPRSYVPARTGRRSHRRRASSGAIPIAPACRPIARDRARLRRTCTAFDPRAASAYRTPGAWSACAARSRAWAGRRGRAPASAKPRAARVARRSAR